MEYGCIGEKLTHSFSREIHNKLFDYRYDLIELTQKELDLFMKNRDFKAINVTIPYKQAVIPYLDFIDDSAKLIGAVNTIVNKDGKLWGYNTDFKGMTALILKNDIEIKNKKVLILGSGGTCLTATAVAKDLGAREILRVSRNKKDAFITYDEVYKYHLDAEIIINTTPVGMYPKIGDAPVDVKQFSKLSGIVDAVYNPLCSQLVCDAKLLGIKAVGGLYMLVAQAVFAAEKFMDTDIEQEKIDLVYKEILLSKRNIVLIGMPSSGKSTIGKALAQMLGMKFIDTDELIVKKSGRDIKSIIQEDGEGYFRALECEAVLEAAAYQNTVIATGGGAILNSRNVELLKGNGRLYFLDRPLEKLFVTDDRPLSNDIQKLKRLYDERYDIYHSCADAVVKCVDDINVNIQALKEDFLKCEF